MVWPMMLKYSYVVDTWAEDQRYTPSQSLRFAFESQQVEFLFNETHQVSGMAVYVPNVELPRRGGKLYLPLSSFPEETAKAFEVASFFVNLLHYQTGKGALIKWPNGPQDYIPETREEAEFREKLLIANFNIPLAWSIAKGAHDLSQATLQRYSRVRDALNIYTDALRLADPISKFRELYRVLERFFPYEGRRFDTTASQYLAHSLPNFTRRRIKILRRLRNKCSHAKAEVITSGDWKGLNQVRAALEDLQKIARVLLENPPTTKAIGSRRWKVLGWVWTHIHHWADAKRLRKI